MSPLTPRGWFTLAFAATLALRGWLSAGLPVTADEAYFVLWGRHPALGYYDHPPAIGWLLAPLVALSDSAWVARLPATLAPGLVALLVRAVLTAGFGRDEATASLAALAVLLLPINLWNVLVTTDAPLMLFSVASLLAFVRAVERSCPGWFLASGVLLGCALLSKYLALLLALAYLAWALCSPGAARRWSGPALAFAAALPFAALNLYWNWQACWCNVLFNAINRHEASGFSLTTVALYAAALAYLGAPLLWFAWRGRGALGAAWRRDGERALILVWLVPLAVFAALSPVKRIGLHWLAPFLPALVVSLAAALGRAPLAGSVRFFAAFAFAHAAAIGALAALPLEAWGTWSLYPRLVFLAHADEILRQAAAEGARYRLAAESYSGAAVLAFHARRDVPVFGAGSSHARHDDILTDWRSYEGRDLLVVRRAAPRLEDYRPYFREVEARRLEVRGAAFHAVLGRGFDYAAYREGVIGEVRRRYYRIPGWLPEGRCYFFERYFPR